MVAQSKKRYEVKLTLGKDLNGRIIRKSFYSTKSKSAAKKKADAFRLRYEMELCVGGSGYIPERKFSDWATYALETYKKPFVKGNTYSGTYLAPLQQRLLPRFGNMLLDSILPLHIQGYVNDMSKTYSPESVKKDFTLLSFILQKAVDNGLCRSNPAGKSIRLPKIQLPEKHAYTQEEYDIVYEFAKTHPYGLAIRVLMETGLTRSELLGLLWSDIDTDKGILRINNGLVAYQDLDRDEWVVESSGLKNNYRKRAIPLVDPELVRDLKRKPRAVLAPNRDGNGSCTVYPENVFHSPEGRPYQPQNWSKRVFSRFMDDLRAEHPEIPRLTAHELRHTRATLWLAQGVPELMVAKLLGHCDLKMLAKIYDHTDVNTLRNALTRDL